jgi:Tfp pilus assembly protein PilV
MKHVHTAGMSIVEVLIGSTIIVTGILALSGTFTQYVNYALTHEMTIQATYLAEEGLEAVTFLREKSWSTYVQPLSTTTIYYVAWDSNALFWRATTTPQYVDAAFLRSFTITDVKRNGSDDIATSGTYDPYTKNITVTVEYNEGSATTTKTMQTYITNLYSN